MVLAMNILEFEPVVCALVYFPVVIAQFFRRLALLHSLTLGRSPVLIRATNVECISVLCS